MTQRLQRRNGFRSVFRASPGATAHDTVARAGSLRRATVILRAAGACRTLSATLLIIVWTCGASGLSSVVPPNAALPERAGLRGPQPFATILCKFTDVPDEPDPIAYFERLLGNTYPGLDHYWQEVSYGAISLAGSMVTGWHVLPRPQSNYLTGTPNLPVPTMESPVDLHRLAGDCVAAAGEAVEWSRYVGINLVFNVDLDRPRGGEVCLPQEGGSKCYRTTWLWPGWYHNQSIWAHEMGHTFGLQHSAVGNGNGYGNMWDVMSVDGPCQIEAGFGRIGQHPIVYQKDILGWISAERIFVAAPDGQATITLEQTAAPGPGNFVLARIPIRDADAGAHYYTVEARRRTGYDASLPGEGIIIHEVNLEGDPQVRLVSTARDRAAAGLTTGSAARWLPGQLFRNAERGITVSIDRATPTGFVVSIYAGPLAATRLASESEETTAEDIVGALPAARRSSGQSKPVTLSAKSGAYAIWTETETEAGDGLMSASSSRSDIYFSHQPVGGGWEPVAKVNDDDRNSRSNPTIAVDRQGNVSAAWVDYRDGIAAIYAATRPAGGEWGKNARVSGGAANGYTGLAIIVDGDDNARVFWEGLDRCGGHAAISDGGE